MSEKNKPQLGRPTKYNPQFHPDLVGALAALGLTDEEICKRLKISKPTLYEWEKKYPDFSNSKRENKENPDRAIEGVLFEKATGKFYVTEELLDENGEVVNIRRKQVPPSDTALIFWLKNRKPADWRDKQEIEHSGGIAVDTTFEIVKVDEVPGKAKTSN